MARARTLTLKTQVDVKGADKLNNLGRRLQTTGRNMTVGLTLPLIALGGALVGLAEQQDRANRKLENTFRSMGAEAWTTTDALKAQASALQDVTTFGDEAILEFQAVMLTFGNVTGEAFDRATKAGLDMSALLGQDLQSSAIQLGKALNDPIKGITALTRVGVSFTEQQKEQIRALSQSGDLLGAQTIILGELERQFGGTAEAMALTAGGQLKQALNALGDAGEEFGAIMAPVLADFANGLKDVAKWLQSLNPETKAWVVRIGLMVAALGPALIVVGSLIRAITALSKAYAFMFVAASPAKVSRFVAGLRAVGAGFHAMLGPIGIVTAAISALALLWVTDFNGIQRATEVSNSILGLHFGDLGDKANRLADRMGSSFDDIKKQVRDRMEETGQSVEQALASIEREFRQKMTPTIARTKLDWDGYADVVATRMSDAVGSVSTGVGDMAAEFEEADQKMADALLADQFQPLGDAIDELNEFAKTAISPAVEIFRAQAFLNSKEYAEKLTDNNPLVRQKAQEMGDAAKEVLDRLDGWSAGAKFSKSFAHGLIDPAVVGLVLTNARKVALAARGIFPDSEPKNPRSPFRGITKGFGFMQILARGLVQGAGAVPKALAGALSMPGLSVVPIGASGGAVIINNNFTFHGTEAGGPNELSNLLQRLSAVSDGSVRYG